MTADEPTRLTTNIAVVPGVGTRRAEAFRRLGIRCVADLVLHLPLRYERELAEQTIAEAAAAVGASAGAVPANIAVRGEIASVRPVRARRRRVEASLEDDTGTMRLTWFHAAWLAGRLHPGQRVRVHGRGRWYQDRLELVNPRLELLGDETEPPPRAGRLRPVYPASEQLPSSAVEQAVEAVLDDALALLDDHLHADYRERTAVPTLADAYRMAHRPGDEDEAAAGRRRLAFDELLMLQLAVFMKRRHRREALRAIALGHSEAIDDHITARIPFTLTPGQRSAIDQITADLVEPRPMNRLLQGDVGSGKTVVALYAMLMAIASRHQAALMAPTELLAEQHFGSISRMLAGARVRMELLTGSRRPAERERVIEALAGGDVDLVVGTHALLTGDVRFRSLAVAVVDEQHRFGVHQRATLRSKAGEDDLVPHTLVMTATPIPRTLSLTLFGDLDVSTVRGMPPGRVGTTTRHVRPAAAADVYRGLAGRLDAGEQAYVVVPVIDESEQGLTDLASHLRTLRDGPLAGRRLAALHGRMTRDERESVMGRFRAGALDALVTTTVIEVGVDVPNATVIVIEHAERFGLAQLHQLRGRVGRGTRPGDCILVADPATDDARARLDALVASDDGFVIAEKDLEIRGPGELFGARQSGLAPFRVAELPRDMELLRMARRDAETWIDENPTLAGERDALLRRRVLKAHGDALGLGDVG
ncbi:MAG: ATP-dependent DNA helicase RecG [Planctomycetota bacterium]|jgi:ATP-dependent DNA helicase RecG